MRHIKRGICDPGVARIKSHDVLREVFNDALETETTPGRFVHGTPPRAAAAGAQRAADAARYWNPRRAAELCPKDRQPGLLSKSRRLGN